MSSSDGTAELLLTCEELGLAEKYDKNVACSSDGRDIFIVSDLHMAAGKRPDGTYSGTENFFAGPAFYRFIQFAVSTTSNDKNKAILVINGDFLDFLRIVELPNKEDEFVAWSQMLAAIGILQTADSLSDSIEDREIKFGLKTHDFKSVWKLDAAIKGHPEVFDALAEWLNAGHKLAILKGNHDLEWYWLAVRNYLRLNLAQRITRLSEENIKNALEEKVLPNIVFSDHSLVYDDELYIEHGHQFGDIGRVVGGPTLEDQPDQLNIPFGSFFNRYLLNRVEITFPYIDNLRPVNNILPFLLRERFFLSLQLIVHHLPFLVRIVPKGYYKYMLNRVGIILVVMVVPFIFMIWHLWNLFASLAVRANGGGFSINFTDVERFFTSFGWLVLSYFLVRFVAYFILKNATDEEKVVEKYVERSNYRLSAFGHNHNPGQYRRNGRWFYNTGTWIPILETTSAEVRYDRTYTFLHLRHDASGSPVTGDIQRWNDEAERVDDMVLVRRDK